MLLRRSLLKSQRNVFNSFASFNTVTAPIEGVKGVAKITMDLPPVNLMGKDFIQAMTKSIKEVEADKSINSLIIDSSQKVYSGGLNLKEFYGASKDELIDFWKAFRELWITIYKSRLATISSIQGPCLAGGCLLAIACDVRIISANCNIGLNEAAFGLVVPPWAIESMIDIIGRREAEKACSLGTLYSAEEALSLGLVDTLVQSPDDVPAITIQEAQKWTTPGRVPTKMLMRGKFVKQFMIDEAEDLDRFYQLVGNERTQAALGMYLASLGKKK